MMIQFQLNLNKRLVHVILEVLCSMYRSVAIVAADV